MCGVGRNLNERQLRRSGRKFGGNVKMDLKEIG